MELVEHFDAHDVTVFLTRYSQGGIRQSLGINAGNLDDSLAYIAVSLTTKRPAVNSLRTIPQLGPLGIYLICRGSLPRRSVGRGERAVEDSRLPLGNDVSGREDVRLIIHGKLDRVALDRYENRKSLSTHFHGTVCCGPRGTYTG